MLVVSNTSPISNLAIIGRLDFLRQRYVSVLIPAEVAVELAALTHPAGLLGVQTALADQWLRVEPPGNRVPRPLPFPLDPGETAAIALACQLSADVLLIGEKRGREAARHFGLVVAGVLGELIHAQFASWIPNVRDEIQRLRRDARFYVDASVEHLTLSQVGE